MSTGILNPPERRPPPADDPFYIGTRTIVHRDDSGKVVHVEYIPLTEEDFLHPQEEDRFMLTDPHSIACVYLQHALAVGCRERSKIKVFADHRIDWQVEGIEPHGPDVVVFDDYEEPEDYRATFHVKDAGAKIVAVFEVTSDGTRHIDFGPKFDEFAEVGIPFYLIVDTAAPNGQPDVQAYRLVRGEYKEMTRDKKLGYKIPNLNLWFRCENDRLVVADREGRDIPASRELAMMMDAEIARANTETARANTETARANSETVRANAEKARADAMAAELAALKASLGSSTPK